MRKISKIKKISQKSGKNSALGLIIVLCSYDCRGRNVQGCSYRLAWAIHSSPNITFGAAAGPPCYLEDGIKIIKIMVTHSEISVIYIHEISNIHPTHPFPCLKKFKVSVLRHHQKNPSYDK